MNLHTLAKLKKGTRLRPGDIFVLQVREGEYGFGRVIRTNVLMMGGRFPLVYLYNSTSPSKSEIPRLDKHKLLAPPIITDRMMWGLGYFQNVAHMRLEDEDILEKHCFFWSPGKRYFDLEKRETTRSEPCGDYAIKLTFSIDDIVSDAFGVPRAVHPPPDYWKPKVKPKLKPKPKLEQ